jgi:hypothetical protein
LFHVQVRVSFRIRVVTLLCRLPLDVVRGSGWQVVYDLLDLSLDKILLKCRHPGVTEREVVGLIPVKNQPPLNPYNPRG